MLNLDSPRWAELQHAYGNAFDIPPLLAELRNLPNDEAISDREPWLTLWSALAHQGDVYSASFAAVPYVINALARDPVRADDSYFHFPAWIEICRVRKAVAIPGDLAEAYFAALARVPALAAAAVGKPWSNDRLVSVLSAIAVSQGHCAVAEAIMELDATKAEEAVEWLRKNF